MGEYIRKTARYNGKKYEATGKTELEAMTKLAEKLAAAKPCSLAKQSAGHGAHAAKRGTAPAGAYRSVQSPLADNRAERGCGP